MDNQNYNEDTNVEEIINEMNACREDERNAQNQLLQTITTAGTILALIFGASYFFKDLSKSILFHLSNLIFCTTIGYIDTLGISNVIRYHYLQNLEDRLFILSQGKQSDQLVHWMSFIAPITTKNIKNIKNKYTTMNYICYTLATICAVLFCIFITFFQFILLESYSLFDKIGIAFLIVFFILSIIVFFYTSVKARNMYDFSINESRKRRDVRTAKRMEISELSPEQIEKNEENNDKKKGNLKRRLKLIFYFLYTRKKDFQKSLLLVLGFITGKIFFGNPINVQNSLKQFIILFIVFDFLVYQARYQWNDIRGAVEDIKEGKGDRLLSMLCEKFSLENNVRQRAKRIVIFSLIIMIIKIISAGVIISQADKQMFLPLLLCSICVFAFAIFYEISRTKKRALGVFLIVSLGYPLRFFAGLWTACPQILNFEFLAAFFSKLFLALQQFWLNGIDAIKGIISPYSIIFLILAFAFWGECSVVLAWTHEAISQKKPQRIHYQYLCKQANYKPLFESENGRIYKIWNWTYIVSVFFLSLSICSICFTNSNQYPLVLILLFELITLLLLICYISQMDMIPIILLFIALKAIFSILCFEWSLFYAYICVTQSLFTIVYHFLRYFFDPKFDFTKLLWGVLIKLFIWVIGKKTSDYIDVN